MLNLDTVYEFKKLISMVIILSSKNSYISMPIWFEYDLTILVILSILDKMIIIDDNEEQGFRLVIERCPEFNTLAI